MRNTIPAVKVMHAIYSVFLSVGNKDYAERKTNNFLKRCGADINKPKEQPLDIARIKEVAYAMLDEDTDNLLWLKLNHQITREVN